MPEQVTPRAEVTVQVHPRSSRAKLAFIGEVLHIWVSAPPVEGAANEAVIGLLAQTARVPRRAVILLRGASARHKRFAIEGITLAELRAKIG
jgi:uncharacterized protein